MSEVVERVARALCLSDLVHVALGGEIGPSETAYADGNWPKYERKARAALEALREPTPEMVEAGAGRLADGPAWRAMIDAALK